MGYLKKTVSKDEISIRRAKISWLSFLDRFILAVLFIAVLCVSLFMGGKTMNLAGYDIDYSVLAYIGMGAFCLVVFVLLGILKIFQCLGADKDNRISKRWLMSNFYWAILCVGIGLLGYFAVVPADMFKLIAMGAAGVFALLLILFAIWRHASIILYVTDKRIFGRVNLIKTKSYDAPLKKIDTITVKYSFFGKIFNYSTITINSVFGQVKYKHVKSGDEFKNTVLDFIAYEERNIQKDFIKYTAECIYKNARANG